MSRGVDRQPGHPGVKLTYDDLLLLFPEDEGKRHELIDGEHFVTPSPNVRHQDISGRLSLLIGMWLEHHPIGRLYYAPVDIVFSEINVVVPDLLYASHERTRQILTAKHLIGAPDIVVEIASRRTRKRDETIKRQLYERSGVIEYWVVDPALDVIRVYRRKGERFARVAELSREAGDVLRTDLLPGLELPLISIFRDLP